MNQENITVQVDLDTRGFERSMAELIRTTERGANYMQQSIEQINMQNMVAEMESVTASISGQLRYVGDEIRAMGADIGSEIGTKISLIGVAIQGVTEFMGLFSDRAAISASELAGLTVELALSKKAHEENIRQIENQAGANNHLVDSIESLIENKNRSAQEDMELINLIDMLNAVKFQCINDSS